MKVEKSQVTKLLLTKIDGLDPVSVFLENFGSDRGKLTVECYGKAWSCYFGAMGRETIQEFIKSSQVEYVADKLSVVDKFVVDYCRIAEDCSISDDLSVENLLYYTDELSSTYGGDWPMSLPKMRNHEYEYLEKIVSAVKEAVRQPAQY